MIYLSGRYLHFYFVCICRAGFTDNEIEAFFEEYEIDPGNVHSQSKRNEILEKLEMNYYEITETAEQYELKQLSIRMDE